MPILKKTELSRTRSPAFFSSHRRASAALPVTRTGAGKQLEVKPVRYWRSAGATLGSSSAIKISCESDLSSCPPMLDPPITSLVLIAKHAPAGRAEPSGESWLVPSGKFRLCKLRRIGKKDTGFSDLRERKGRAGLNSGEASRTTLGAIWALTAGASRRTRRHAPRQSRNEHTACTRARGAL